jgi:hypothetical protein
LSGITFSAAQAVFGSADRTCCRRPDLLFQAGSADRTCCRHPDLLFQAEVFSAGQAIRCVTVEVNDGELDALIVEGLSLRRTGQWRRNQKGD